MRIRLGLNLGLRFLNLLILNLKLCTPDILPSLSYNVIQTRFPIQVLFLRSMRTIGCVQVFNGIALFSDGRGVTDALMGGSKVFLLYPRTSFFKGVRSVAWPVSLSVFTSARLRRGDVVSSTRDPACCVDDGTRFTKLVPTLPLQSWATVFVVTQLFCFSPRRFVSAPVPGQTLDPRCFNPDSVLFSELKCLLPSQSVSVAFCVRVCFKHRCPCFDIPLRILWLRRNRFA